MGTIILPPTTVKKPIAGGFYGLSGYGVFQGGGSGIRIISITQTVAGSCDLNLANPCVATSTHKVNTSVPEGAITYTWSITLGTATIVSGQGTDTVEVSTDSESLNDSFQMTCKVDDTGEEEPSTDETTVYINHTRVEETFFDGGMFINGGFERGLDDWFEYSEWLATPDADTVENPAVASNQILYQNLTLQNGYEYTISATHLEGDSTVTYLVNDVDSGVNIEDGEHSFIGDGVARSIGIFISTLGTTKSVIDNMRLVHSPSGVVDFSAEPNPLVVEYTGVTYASFSAEPDPLVVEYIGVTT